LTLRIKFGHAKHCTKDTVLFRTGQATASFFILAICFPPATPFKSCTYCFGVGCGFSGSKMSTTYFVAGGSSVIDFSTIEVKGSNYFFVTDMVHKRSSNIDLIGTQLIPSWTSNFNATGILENVTRQSGVQIRFDTHTGLPPKNRNYDFQNRKNRRETINQKFLFQKLFSADPARDDSI
jgi:hypothetical protein